MRIAAGRDSGNDDRKSDGLVTVTEACQYLKVSRGTIYALMSSGKLKTVKIRRSRRVVERSLYDLASGHNDAE